MQKSGFREELRPCKPRAVINFQKQDWLWLEAFSEVLNHQINT